MSVNPGTRFSSTRAQRWLRRYPPLLSILVALMIAFLVLPSALTLPQANPTTVLEYAPVPPDEQNREQQAPEGQLSELGLGVSRTVNTGVPEKKPNVQLPGGQSENPITKRCVGKPLRQTEDPNAPPCVPHFEGDNGGETWQGVTKEEIVVLMYVTAVTNIPDQNGDEAEDSPATTTYCDVDAPPESDPNCLDQAGLSQDHREVRVARAMAKYFNERFQTYGRHVHFYVYYSTGNATPSSRQADATDNWKKLKPFAVIDRAIFGGHNQVYAEAMVKKNVLVFGNFTALTAEIYQKFSPYLWSFWPDVEHWAQNYTSYLCEKIAPHPNVAMAGSAFQGKPRKVALMYSAAPSYPGLQRFEQLVKAGIGNCPNGKKIDVAMEVNFPNHTFQIDSDPEATEKAQLNVASMKNANITTVLWAGGYEVEHTKAAAAQQWFPEWIVAGDLFHDFLGNSRAQDQSVWRYARIVSNILRQDRSEDAPCKQAFREADPNARVVDEFMACEQYRPMFQMFKSIQVAGPDLRPDTIDQGQHAIQRRASTGPYVAACFYDPGDYTCVKDAFEAWWDPNAPDPDGRPDLRGCWRLVREGSRFLPGSWEGNDRDAFSKPTDPCNAADAIGQINV